jgi:hypothetical protein
MTYNQSRDGYDFTLGLDDLLTHSKNNFEYLVQLFIAYYSAKSN